ncbi:hypothetical protein Pmani_026680 [Petrolisthes manimaculis]|uniref:UNC93-like protein n=1 Tax=Petrolisthes manimaculis TaxID=1843537 RepID=A0AAE1P365_9EUCA|nr:hypothetical protein Pmani_026680 [Petrolisthes manimaculis]
MVDLHHIKKDTTTTTTKEGTPPLDGLTNHAYIKGDDDTDNKVTTTSSSTHKSSHRGTTSKGNEKDKDKGGEGIVEGIPAADQQHPQWQPGMERMAILKNLIIISLSFVFLFTSYNAVANLQSSLHRGLGTIALSSLYTGMVISCLLLPTWAVRTLGEKTTMFLSTACYSGYVAAQLYPRVYTLVPTCLVLGVAAAPLWAAKCTYLTKIAIRYAEVTGQNSELVITRFFGIFFLFYQSTNIWGNLISSSGKEREVGESEGREREVDESEGRERDVDGSEGREREGRESEGREREVGESEGKEREVGESEGREREVDESEGRERDVDGSEGREREGRESEGREREVGESEGKEREVGESEGREREVGESEGREREVGESEGKEREVGESEGREREVDGSEGRERDVDESEGRERLTPSRRDSQMATVMLSIGVGGITDAANETEANLQHHQQSLDTCGYHFCISEPNVTTSSSEEVVVAELTWRHYIIFSVFLAASVCSALVMMLVDPVTRFVKRDPSQDDKSIKELILATFIHMRHPYQLVLIPLTIWSGLEQQFLSTDYTAAYVSCSVGVHMLGYVLIAYGVSDSLGCLTITALMKKVGRVPGFILACVLNIILIIVFIYWPPRPEHLPWLFICAAFWGLADSVWQTQINALYSVVFPPETSPSAFSNYRLWESVGMLVAYITSTALCVDDKITILLTFLVVGMAGYVMVEVMERRGGPPKDSQGKVIPLDKLITSCFS